MEIHTEPDHAAALSISAQQIASEESAIELKFLLRDVLHFTQNCDPVCQLIPSLHIDHAIRLGVDVVDVTAVGKNV